MVSGGGKKIKKKSPHMRGNRIAGFKNADLIGSILKLLRVHFLKHLYVM